MGKYRATLNMAEAKRGQVATFNDDERRVIRMVLDGHLVPVDVSPEVQARIDEARTSPRQVANTSTDAVKEALRLARERHGVSVPGGTPPPAPPKAAPEVVPEAAAEAAPEAAAAPEVVPEDDEEEMVPQFSSEVTTSVSRAVQKDDPAPPRKMPSKGRGPAKRGGGR